MMGLRDSPPRGALGSFDRADSYIGREEVLDGGCSFGSLANEILKTDLDVHDEITAGFDRWKQVFRSASRPCGTGTSYGAPRTPTSSPSGRAACCSPRPHVR
jgi:hypothetical protein